MVSSILFEWDGCDGMTTEKHGEISMYTNVRIIPDKHGYSLLPVTETHPMDKKQEWIGNVFVLVGYNCVLNCGN